MALKLERLPWHNNTPASGSRVFSELQEKFPVSLISTPRSELVTCFEHEELKKVRDRVCNFDHLPVERVNKGERSFVGLLDARQAKEWNTGCVRDKSVSISDKSLLGANASILSFISSADTYPCRIVLDGSEVLGIVTLSDIQRLPARAALLTGILSLEASISEIISAKYPDGRWRTYLCHSQTESIERAYRRSLKNREELSDLSYVNLSNKIQIFIDGCLFDPIEKIASREQLSRIKKLRNDLAHVDDYAERPASAFETCGVARDMITVWQLLSCLWRDLTRSE